MNPMDDQRVDAARWRRSRMVEQITNMATANTQIATIAEHLIRVGLIGRTVTYIDADDSLPTPARSRGSPRPRTAASTLTVAGTDRRRSRPPSRRSPDPAPPNRS